MNAEQVLNPTIANIDSLSSRLLAKRLGRIHYGELHISFESGEKIQFTGPYKGPRGNLIINNPGTMLRRSLLHGATGFGESYMAGDWSSTDLAQTLELLLLNRPFIGYRKQGNILHRTLDNLQHFKRRNSIQQSRKNINYHYDIGNDFYELWLDETMSYSSAVFGWQDEPLENAQSRKYNKILDSLDAQPGEHLLEIGCGWGSLAIEAARRGLSVTAITLSEEQRRLAQERIRSAGLANRVQVRLCDYRNITGCFDHIVSIEMFEAVGEAYWQEYFKTLSRLLKQEGRAALQVITIHDSLFRNYRRSTDFIQKYIFPGGMLPSPRVFCENAISFGLGVVDKSFYGMDYAETLSAWSQRFLESMPAARLLDYSDEFLRMWHYYLAYCETGFRTGQTDLMQITLQRV